MRDLNAQRSHKEVIQAWQAHRSYLIDLAFRMLGDIGAAEDVVQDAFSRLLRTTPGEIDDARGWMIVVTSRLCLDQIRSARARRERPHDANQIEFVGVLVRLLIRCQKLLPGSAPSRENA